MRYFLMIIISLLAFNLQANTAQISVDSQRYETLLKELRCLVCQNQDLLDSHAPLALDLQALVLKQMQAGKTDIEIKDYLVQRYGEFILFKPPVTPLTYLLWFGPGLLLALSIVSLCIWSYRRKHYE